MTPLAPSPRPASPSRGRWPLRDYPSLFWLMAALLVAVLGRQLPSSRWLLVHLVLLGALSHAILVWSNYRPYGGGLSEVAFTSATSKTATRFTQLNYC